MTKRVTWLHKRLESLYAEAGGWQNMIISVVAIVVLLSLLIPLLHWGVWRAVWTGDVTQCHNNGACWIYIEKNAVICFTVFTQKKHPGMDSLA